MVGLQLVFLGDLQVIRDGEPQALPPSKKTRALLAYLALNPRSFRREFLCELLWEIPDDPRGSLRWSLSKLRRLVDGDDRPRIIADRASVRFDVTDIEIDVNTLRDLVDNHLEQASVETLEAAANRYCQNFLQDLELNNLHEFHAWCIAERELLARAQVKLLGALADRLAADPVRALPHVRALTAIDPYDENARARLIRLLMALDRNEEAEQQYQQGMHMLEEIGANSTGQLFQAWRGRPGGRSASRPTPVDKTAVSMSAESLLVGRDAELDSLASALTESMDTGRAGVVLVRGDPGIGKSRLLETVSLSARDADAFLLEASAFESESIRPYGLWIDACRRYAPDAVAEIFGDGHLENRDRLFGRLSELICREGRQRPVVIIFDDFQWCDESSAAALHYVARMNRQLPVFVALAAREGELQDNSPVLQALRGLRHDNLLAELRLSPLPEAAVRQLIQYCAPQADAERLSRECGGNPLLAIELARAQAAGISSGTAGATTPAASPESTSLESGGSLDELLRERMSRMDSDAVEVLHWAAVLSPRIDLASLSRVTDMDSNRIGELLESAERIGLLLPSDRGFRFSHDLITRSIYQQISTARRRVMHHRIAGILEADTALDLERAADLAYHAAQSGDPGLAARAMVSAGRLCLRFFANEDALKLAEKGLNLAAGLPEAENIRLKLELRDIMMAAAPLKDWRAAAEEFVALAERALDFGALNHARLGYQMASYLRWEHGQWADARDESLQAERITRSGSDQEQIIGMAETAKCLAMLERDLSQADAMLMEARSLAQRRRLSHQALPAALGLLRFHQDRMDEAEELLKESRTLCKAAGDRINEFLTNEYLVMIDIERGRFEAACARCAALTEIGEKLREGSEAPFARAMEGVCRYALNDQTEELDSGIEALRIADAKHRLAYVLTRAAQVDIERDRPDAAIARASEALACAEVLERSTDILLAHLALARACRAMGDETGCHQHMVAIQSLGQAQVALWARKQAETFASQLESGEPARG